MRCVLTGQVKESVYKTAQENGYTGSEAEFYEDLVSLKDGPFLPLTGGIMNTDATVRAQNSFVLTTARKEYDGKEGITLALGKGLSGLYKNSQIENILNGIFSNKGITYLGTLDITNPFQPHTGFVVDELGNIRIVKDHREVVEISDKNILCLNPPGGNYSLVNKEYVDNKVPKAVQVTLRRNEWLEIGGPGLQSVDVFGVLADETKQLIIPMPAIANQDAYAAAGITCTGQRANTLTFKCQTVPTEDINVFVVMQEVIL